MKRIRSKYNEATLAMAAMIPNMEAVARNSNVTLPMAVGAWCGKCCANAEIVAVRLVETAQTGKGVAA